MHVSESQCASVPSLGDRDGEKVTDICDVRCVEGLLASRTCENCDNAKYLPFSIVVACREKETQENSPPKKREASLIT